MDDLFDMLEEQPSTPPKEKKSFFKKKEQPEPEEPPQPPVKKPKKTALQEEPKPEPKSSWTRVNASQLTENEVIVEKVEDVIKKPEREIGTYIKNTIDINDARGLDLSLRERIQLTKMYLTKEQEDIKALEEISKQEEIKLNHVLTLRNFLLNELQEHLTDVNCEMVVEIDAKFAPYIQDVIREIELSYYCKEIPRNHDLARLHPNLPYRWSFKIRAI